MGFSLYLGPFQPFLEEKLLEEIAAFRSTEPSRPLTVVVPNLMLTRHLSMLAARRPQGLFNARFQTLRHFLQEVTEPSLLAEGARAAPEALTSLLLRQIARDNADARKVFGSVIETPGFIRALRDTLGDLRHAQWDATALRQAASSLKTVSDREALGEKWRAFASVLEDFNRVKKRRGWIEEDDCAERALFLPVGTSGNTWVYGFYDATTLQKRILARWAGSAGSCWFVPFRDQPAYAYARPFVAHVRSKAGRVTVWKGGGAGGDRLSTLRGNLFDSASAPSPSILGDESLTIELCAGESGEMRQAARVFAGLGPEDSLGDCAVIMRASESYRHVLSSEFKALGVAVEWRLHHSLLETPEGKAAVTYLDALAEGFPRALLSQWLFCPCLRPEFFGLQEESWDAPAWDALFLRFGVVAGLAQWRERIRRAVSNREGEDALRTQAAGNLNRVLSKLSRMEKEFRVARTWADKARCLSLQLAQAFETSPALNLLRASLEPLINLQNWVEPAEPADFARGVEDLWEGEKFPREDSTPGGVVVTDLMEARGVPFAHVAFPGLTEKVIPWPVRKDPLLPDTDRQALNESIPASLDAPRLALKGDGVLEERMLFALAAESARKSLWLTAPVRDVITGEARVVSPYLEEAVRAVAGTLPTPLAAKDTWVREAHSPSSDPASLADCDRREDAFLFYLRERARGDPSWFLAATRSAPFFFEGSDLLRKRQVVRAFTPYDGMLSSPEALRTLAERYALERQELSASQLETYAACPLRYFFKYVLRLEVVSEPEALLEMEEREKGSLAHRVLEAVLRKGQETGWLKSRDQAAAAECLQAEAETLFRKYEERGWTGALALWQWQKRRLLADLKDVVDGVLDDSEWTPFEFEAVLGAEGGMAFPLDSGVSLRLRGRVDRVDVSSDGKSYRVIDYKTGSSNGFLKSGGYYGGRKIQLPLYLWATRDRFPSRRGIMGVYDFITAKGGYKKFLFREEDPEKMESTLRNILGTVAHGVAEGSFPSAANECEFCDFKALCGTGMKARAERKKEDLRAAAYYALQDLP